MTAPKEKPKIVGWVEIIVKDKHGRVKYHIKPGFAETKDDPIFPACQTLYYWRGNVITNVGLAEMVKLIFGLGGSPFKYLAIGTGTTTESVTDTALENEIARKQASITQTTTNVSNDTALLEATFSKADGLTGTANVSEAGVFNASSGGVLLARKTFSPVPVNWDAGDSITIRYYIQMSR